MFVGPEPTVFIIGAGASWHYGYPTGETLVKKIVEKTKFASKFFDIASQTPSTPIPSFVQQLTKSAAFDVRDPWMLAKAKCDELCRRLTGVNPLVIDYFLGWNPAVQDIGKLMIAWVILECEEKASKQISNPNREQAGADDWCRFIVHHLAMHCEKSSDLLKNKVQFVTFNYDVSLERSLVNGLRHIELFEDADIDLFMSNHRIVHVYGKVRESTDEIEDVKWASQSISSDRLVVHQVLQHGRDFKHLLDCVSKAAAGLRVIDPVDKVSDIETLKLADKHISAARHIIILGYGFDEENNKRLGLYKNIAQATPAKFVSFTNFENNEKVNKRASAAFFGHRDKFSTGKMVVDTYEKSIKNVYEALNFDLDIV